MWRHLSVDHVDTFKVNKHTMRNNTSRPEVDTCICDINNMSSEVCIWRNVCFKASVTEVDTCHEAAPVQQLCQGVCHRRKKLRWINDETQVKKVHCDRTEFLVKTRPLMKLDTVKHQKGMRLLRTLNSQNMQLLQICWQMTQSFCNSHDRTRFWDISIVKSVQTCAYIETWCKLEKCADRVIMDVSMAHDIYDDCCLFVWTVPSLQTQSQLHHHFPN